MPICMYAYICMCPCKIECMPAYQSMWSCIWEYYACTSAMVVCMGMHTYGCMYVDPCMDMYICLGMVLSFGH